MIKDEKKVHYRDLKKINTIFTDHEMSFTDYNPSRPSDRSKYAKTYRFTPKTELSKYDLPFSCTRVPMGRLPPIEVEFDKGGINKYPSTLQHNVNQYLPPLDHGLKHINRLRDLDSLFKHDEYLLNKKSNLYKELCNITTGEQSIAFFARNGLNNPIKFITCEKKHMDNDVSKNWENRPYDLRVINISNNDSYKPQGDYFTITMHGIIIYKKDPLKKGKAKYLTEFLSLAEWMRQSTMFDYIAEIKFFRFYMIRKILMHMHNKVRRKMFLEKRRSLMNKLFMTKPVYSQKLMEIKEEIWSFQIDNIYETKSEHADNDIEVNKFLDEVDTKLRKISQDFEMDLTGKIKQLLVDLCKTVKKKTVQEDEDDIFKYDKNKPLIYQAQEANLKRIKSMFAIEDNKMLLDFLKLVQHMMRGRIYDEFLYMIQNFYNEISSQANKESQNANAKYFKITVSFDRRSGTSYSPNWSLFESSITKLFNNSLDTLDKLKRLLDINISSEFSSFVDLSQYDLHSFKRMSVIFRNDEKYNNCYKNLVEVTNFNWDKAVTSYKKSFDLMQDIVYKASDFNKDDYVLTYSDEEVQNEIENEGTIDKILNHVKKINDEYSKLDKYNSQLKDLQRCKLGILDFNMIESNEVIKAKVLQNLDELRANLKDPSEKLDLYLRQNINIAKNFMSMLKEYQWPSESDDITEDILKDYYKNKIKYNYYAKQDTTNDKPNYISYLAEVRKSLEEALRFTGSSTSNIQNIQKNMKDINTLHVECDKNLNMAKTVIEIRLDQDIKDNDGKIKAYTTDLIEDHKENNSDIYQLNIPKMRKKYQGILDEVVKDKDYFVEYKALLGSKVNEYEMQSLDEFISRCEYLINFYKEIENFLAIEKKYYMETPVVRLDKVDNWNYQYNDEFDVNFFVNYIMDTKKNSADIKKILKQLELVNNFYNKINYIFVSHLEVIRLVASEDLRYAHWVEIYEVELNLIIKNEIMLKELFENNINTKTERVKEISDRAKDQRTLRLEGESYLKKWHEYKVTFNYKGDEITISNSEKIISDIKVDTAYIRNSLLNHREKLIIENELSELLSSLNMYDQVIQVLQEFQDYWLKLNAYFEDLDVQQYLKDENKRFREYDRFFRSIINNSNDVEYIRKVVEVCMKTAKRSKITNFEQLKLILVNLREFKQKIENYKEELRLNRIFNKIYKYDLSKVQIISIPEVLTGIIFRSDFELDDREDMEDEMYSAENDEVFIQKKTKLDKELEKLGVYNDNIKPWYFKHYNKALVSPTGKCLKEEKHSRENYDVWQIGVVLVDMLTRGLLFKINEKYIKDKDGDFDSICKMYYDIAAHQTPYAYIKEIFNTFLEHYEGEDVHDWEEKIDEVGVFIGEVRMEYNEDVETMMKNCLQQDKNDRCTLEELLNYNFIKKIWNHNN